MSLNFGYENGQVVTDRLAAYQVEHLQNGFVHVFHRPSGLASLVDPESGDVRHGQANPPPDLISEIRSRWGGE